MTNLKVLKKNLGGGGGGGGEPKDPADLSLSLYTLSMSWIIGCWLDVKVTASVMGSWGILGAEKTNNL